MNIVIKNIKFMVGNGLYSVDDKSLPLYISEIIKVMLAENHGIQCDTEIN